MRRVLTPGWLVMHVLTVAAVGFMLWLAGWQLARGIEGNSISWGYAFQWPVFAGFTVFIWAREVRRAVRGAEPDPEPPPPPVSRRPVVTRRAAAGGAGGAGAVDDPDLAAYNRYLAWLNANPGARPGDYPG